MNTIQILNLSVDELENIIIKAINLAWQNIPSNQSKQPELITRQETAKMLDISLTTLNEWTKQGKVPAHRLGNRVYYKPIEVFESLKRIKS